jgi:hypothetical protein
MPSDISSYVESDEMWERVEDELVRIIGPIDL